MFLLTFESADEIPNCDHLNESYWGYFFFPVLTFIMLYKVVLPFEFVDEIVICTTQMKAVEQYFPVVLLIML